MSFLYPLGFLGLLAVPVLIVIYIIKNKYTEQVIASTYLWTLSERFLKRRNPINKIAGIISLILQILAVVAISVAVAHPVFTLTNAADDYCFVLDASGSMNLSDGESTRFERAKQDIRSRISSAAEGSVFTLVTAGDHVVVVYENTTDKDMALRLLEECEPSYAATDPSLALPVVQGYFTDTRSVHAILFTDKDYEVHENAEIVNFSRGEINYALADTAYTFKSGGVEIVGKAYSYESDATVTVEVYFNDETERAAAQELSLSRLAAGEFVFQIDRTGFSSVKVKIAEADALALDSEIMMYNAVSENEFKTLIVSGKNEAGDAEQPSFFLRAALSSMGIPYTLLTAENYLENERGGYGLYIFDGYSPAVLPRDGAVWFINPQGNTARTGFNFLNREELAAAGRIAYSTSTASRVRKLLEGTFDDEAYVKEYAKCSFARTFTTLLSYNGDPLLFVGSTEYGTREVVYAFGLNNGDFALSINNITLMRNLINYTFPSIADQTDFTCGDTGTVNILENVTSVRMEAPSGKVDYLDTSSTSADYTFTEVGTYTCVQIAGDTVRSLKLFSRYSPKESLEGGRGEAFSLTKTVAQTQRDGTYSSIFYLFILLAVIVIADWMVYCYEQYQLR